MLTKESVATVRSKLSPSSPYKERPDLSLQTLGFIDSQRRFLPKALSYIPELDQSLPTTPQRLLGRVRSAKTGGYGFITDDDGIEYFFHISHFHDQVEWERVEPDLRVSFFPGPPKSPGLLDTASDIKCI